MKSNGESNRVVEQGLANQLEALDDHLSTSIVSLNRMCDCEYDELNEFVNEVNLYRAHLVKVETRIEAMRTYYFSVRASGNVNRVGQSIIKAFSELDAPAETERERYYDLELNVGILEMEREAKRVAYRRVVLSVLYLVAGSHNSRFGLDNSLSSQWWKSAMDNYVRYQ